MKKQDQDLFYKKLTDKSGLYDEESVKMVYFGLIRSITEGLRIDKSIELPFLGTFSLRGAKGKIGGMLAGVKAPGREVKFEPFYAFKAYFKKLF